MLVMSLFVMLIKSRYHQKRYNIFSVSLMLSTYVTMFSINLRNTIRGIFFLSPTNYANFDIPDQFKDKANSRLASL